MEEETIALNILLFYVVMFTIRKLTLLLLQSSYIDFCIAPVRSLHNDFFQKLKNQFT